MTREPQRLIDVLNRGTFAVTVEYNPPKGTNISSLLESAKQLVGRVHGVNVTDNTAAVVRAGSLPVCRLLYELGHDPVMQLTCRDRNRIAMQSDLMGAHMLGIRNILCLTGDYPTVGDHKEAKPVYDLDSVQVMQLVQGLNNGKDMVGNKLDGATAFAIGAAVTPEADLVGPVLAKFEVKVKAGAQFFQTQAVYNPDVFASFMKQVRPFKVKVLAGILVLRNYKMAEFMNANIPGMSVPKEMIDELKAAGDRAEDVGVEIAVQSIKAVRPHCDGVHIMAIKATHRLAEIITKAELG
ncbi:MAG: methylenetetrahydrofolate reductase [Nitrospira sp.]|jgi:methylenetetrahydrofolate reductase (NADPH)|nr:methylenetetrahydrofolate reductase [Nitrospira sp.]MDH4244045.1 methylenetetrahydrofolate reductase [Nitrospira sp.]MDH4357129.1 methylenetetrahydrofolate reductase [Nitrospira sp.]MDH5319137.1 methylenetetrahydrofolate reductase [Nitrospira sp.]